MGSVSIKFNKYRTFDIETCEEIENISWSLLRFMDNLGDTSSVKLKIREESNSYLVEVVDDKGEFDFLANQEEIDSYLAGFSKYIGEYDESGFSFS